MRRKDRAGQLPWTPALDMHHRVNSWASTTFGSATSNDSSSSISSSADPYATGGSAAAGRGKRSMIANIRAGRARTSARPDDSSHVSASTSSVRPSAEPDGCPARRGSTDEGGAARAPCPDVPASGRSQRCMSPKAVSSRSPISGRSNHVAPCTSRGVAQRRRCRTMATASAGWTHTLSARTRARGIAVVSVDMAAPEGCKTRAERRTRHDEGP